MCLCLCVCLSRYFIPRTGEWQSGRKAQTLSCASCLIDLVRGKIDKNDFQSILGDIIGVRYLAYRFHEYFHRVRTAKMYFPKQGWILPLFYLDIYSLLIIIIYIISVNFFRTKKKLQGAMCVYVCVFVWVGIFTTDRRVTIWPKSANS